MEPKLSLVEVFAAPQGEGYNSGRMAVFVRLAGCPLACEFAPGVVCDTPYMDGRLKLTISELFRMIFDLTGPRIISRIPRLDELPMLILTGGEPTAAPQFDALVDAVQLEGFYVSVETNGTRWREGLRKAEWLSVSPKENVAQTSQAVHHNHNPQSTKLDPIVVAEMTKRQLHGGEYRYVITADSPQPPYDPAERHYLSPAVRSDGSGEEWKTGFPGFVPGAVQRCLEIITDDPRWRISIQQHKILGVR